MAARDFPESYKDPVYASADAAVEQRLGIPVGTLSSVRVAGEKTNASQVSSAGARTPYQIIPATRDAILKQYGIDAYLSPETAAEAAGLLLRDSLKRNNGDQEAAVREYHGGTNRENWGKINDAYWGRVRAGIKDAAVKAIVSDLDNWQAANPAVPASKPQGPQTVGQSTAGGLPPGLLDMVDSWRAGGDRVPFGIPGGPDVPNVPADRAPVALGLPPKVAPQEPGILDKAIGTGEAALNTVTSGTGGTLGMIGGTLKGLAEQILSGNFGTPEAANLVEQSAAQGAQAVTYAPRTQSGQDQAAAVGQAFQQVIPAAAVMHTLPVPVGSPAPAGVLAKAGLEGAARSVAGDGAAAAVAKAGDAATRVADMAKSQVTSLPRRALEAIRGTPEEATPGTLGSVGSAATDMATQRRATAEQLGFTGDTALTKGQATRDAAQLKFETETAKIPEAGTPLRTRAVAQNDQILRNFDSWIDQTGAEAPTLRAVGQSVDKALTEAAKRDKVQIRTAYAAAEKAGELETTVTLGGVVDHLNEVAPESATAPLIDVARRVAIKQGIAVEGPDGLLQAAPVTLKRAESFRQAVSRATDYEPTNVRQATIIKGLLDEATNGLGGNLYQQARALRRRFAQNYEDRAVIAKLLNEKRGTADRQVALEDVHRHSILNGSLDDVRNVRRVLHRSGPEGAQAWRELQGSTAQWVKEQATKNVATDSAGNRVISPAALDQAIKSLDVDGRLDFIFGKKGAQKMRDLRDLAQYVKTVPPEAAVNTSNTAMTLLSIMADTGASGMAGMPMPVLTLTRTVRQYVKDRALRRRIEDALNEMQRKQAPGKNNPTAQAPGRSQSIH